jgi:chromosomal replication initiation ATPase DnaA
MSRESVALEYGALRRRRVADDQRRAVIVASLVAWVAKSSAGDILSAERSEESVSRARQLVMHVCHEAFGISFDRIADAIGRDRSTVKYGATAVVDRCNRDAELARTVATLVEIADHVERHLLGGSR